jgi:PAS domain S-box-containing protein
MATVLVVDDRASNLELASDVLGYGGHTVIEAHEGAEALDLAHARHPDLILTDILMPVMDGYQVARELRAAADTAHTPIVFYTANYRESETRPFAEACGVARVLLKSSDPQTLLRVIAEVLAERREVGGPIDTTATDREHLHAVSAKLIEKVAELSNTEARFRLMADFSPVGIAFGDQHGCADYANPRLIDILGMPNDDRLGLAWLRCAADEHHDDILAAVRGCLPSSGLPRFRSQIRRPDGALRWLDLQVRAIHNDDGEHGGFLSIVDDVTGLVEADRQQRHAERKHDLEAGNRATERLESLSRLAGGIAHDFNNIVSVILGFESLAVEYVTDLTASGGLGSEPSETLLGYLERIHQGSQRATALTRQLLAFGARTVINPSPLDLNQAIRESNDLLAPTIGAHIHFVTDLAVDLPTVMAEPTSIAQVLLNLTINASHAMPDGGTLTITTSHSVTTDDIVRAGPPPDDQYARLTINDTGHGMTPETLQRAIEPFFTTKAPGQGTGLGLATTYGIVNQLGGHLQIDSTVAHGTLVTIDLPVTDQAVEAAPPIHIPQFGAETILLAEDESGIRDVVARILSKAGYSVVAAADGPSALDLAERHAGPIDLLLSDVIMPGMLGNELATRLLMRRPTTKVLFMSGYAGDLMNEQGILAPDVTVLPKPFTENELLTTVRAMIDIAVSTTSGEA